MTEPLIKVENISKKYGHVEILKGLSLEVHPHEVVALIGASGSGKSTLLRCINGLEDISAGSVHVNGKSVHGKWVDIDVVRSGIGMVFQQYNLFPRMTVLENVVLAPREVRGIPQKEAETEALKWLARVGLEEKAESYPDKLSGGQQQRVAIARALAMKPTALLLDEITSALDPELVGEVLEIVRSLAMDGMTLILATHEMSFAREVADRVCFLVGGEIYEEGPPELMFTQPKREITQQFLRRIIDAGRL